MLCKQHTVQRYGADPSGRFGSKSTSGASGSSAYLKFVEIHKPRAKSYNGRTRWKEIKTWLSGLHILQEKSEEDESEESEDDDDDYDLIVLTRKFKRIIKGKSWKKKETQGWRRISFEREKYRREVKCFECKKFGHINANAHCSRRMSENQRRRPLQLG